MVKQYFNLIKYESLLTLKANIRYKLNFISDFAIFFLIYIIVLFFNNGENFSEFYTVSIEDSKMLMLIGIVFWQISVIALGYSSSGISGSFVSGTLELRLQSKFSIIIMQFVRTCMDILTSIISLVIILSIAYFFMEISFSDFYRIFYLLVVIIPSILGMFGMGLIFGGLTLVTKSLGQFLMIFQTVLLFVSNSLFPSNFAITQVIPFTLGTEIARNLYLEQAISLETVGLYLVVNLVWLLIGVIFFNKMLTVQRTKGIFDTY